MRARWAGRAFGGVLAAALGSCVPAMRATPGPPGDPPRMAEFWAEPADLPERDLLAGPWGREHAPDPGVAYRFAKEKEGGFSRGYTVVDPHGTEWSAKLGAEAQSEVTASRLVWAAGFHQPPVYHLRSWTLEGGPSPGEKGPARFRPDLPLLEKESDWSWHRNPFVGTAPWRGALALMVLLNNSDLKPDQNVVYALKPPRGGLGRWFVVRDLGHTFGESGIVGADRNDPREFESERFVVGVRGGRVLFNFTSRYPELTEQLRPADVRWACARLARLSPRQWDDAFRAGGYDEATGERLERRLQRKVATGLGLPD